MLKRVSMVASGLGLLLTAGVRAQTGEDLGRFFGFSEARIVVVDDGCGPTAVADFNGDGRPDLAIVNNRKSRIELHLLRAAERTEAEIARRQRANELPPSPWYDRVDVSVAHRVTAIKPFDFDGDGKLDLIYAGTNPAELVFMRQISPGNFETVLRRRVADLSAGRSGLEIADVMGDNAPELITLADGKVQVFPIRSDSSQSGRVSLGDPITLGSSGKLVAIYTDDFNGDGLIDLVAVAPEDAAPVRVWLQRQDPRIGSKAGLLNAELRFDMPALREVEPIRFPDRPAASMGVIERASKRSVFYDLIEAPVDADELLSVSNAETIVQAEVTGFPDGDNKDRSIVVADVDADGLPDILATDVKANTVVLYRQSPGVGLTRPESFSAFKKPKQVAVGRWRNGGDQSSPDVFVLSEDEKAVGVTKFDVGTGRLGFPAPLPIRTSGATPVAMGFVDLSPSAPGSGGRLAVVVKDRRDHTLELHSPPQTGSEPSAESVVAFPLKDVSRPPQSVLSADVDHDGLVDILLFTPNEPMIMLRATGDANPEKAFEVLTDKQMPQFGLVQAAGPDNTVLLDIDKDGSPELLIATENFVRACRYDARAGWRVVEQVTIRDNGTRLSGLTVLNSRHGPMIVASDRGNSRLVILARDSEKGEWKVRTRLRLDGFALGAVAAGNFAGKASAGEDTGILAFSGDSFALVRLGGRRYELDSFAAFSPEDEQRTEHRMRSGDVNSDGFVDVVTLDAAERRLGIYTFSASRKLHFATEFEVFQARLFRGGASREFEPRELIITDATGDARHDLILTVHDRVIVYPQSSPAGR
ncbi:MAG: VCBS repeat-containing protein [Phycisphaeraceae bacterium]|nr:VCBS repeat-containing protein [Phycisphaeraceae bacterium]